MINKKGTVSNRLVEAHMGGAETILYYYLMFGSSNKSLL